MPGCRLTLLLPGLFGPAADPLARGGREQQLREAGTLCAGLKLPRLARLLSRGRERPSAFRGASLEALYFSTFGISAGAQGELPVAALSAAADGLDAQAGAWLRADPVYLRPDLGCLILRDGRDLKLQLQEARQLAAELNHGLQDLDVKLELQVAAPRRWYLQLEAAPRLRSCSPASVHGFDANSGLAQGEDARHWHQIQNQMQMLLHQSPVNSARESRGQVPVNSLWFWGSGVLPPKPEQRWKRVWGDDYLIAALARHCGSEHGPLPEHPASAIEDGEGDSLLLSRRAARAVHDQDRESWLAALENLESAWLGPLLEALLRKQLELLTVDGGSGRSWSLSARQMRRWWRRDQALSDLFCNARVPLP